MKSRYRERGAFVDSTMPRTVVRYSASTGAKSESVTSTVVEKHVGSFDFMYDWVGTNFRKVQAEGGIVNTATSWSRESRRLVGSVGGYTGVTTAPDWKTLYGTDVRPGDLATPRFGLPPLLAVSTARVDNMKTAASTAALSDVEGPEVQGQVFLAELLKTLKMLRRPFEGLRLFIDGWKKRQANRRYKGGAKFVPTAAGCWLELRYGWRPFLLEVEQIMKSLLGGKPGGRKTARATQRFTDSQVSNGTFVSSGVEFDLTHVQTQSIEVRAGILYESKMDLNGQFGMTWADLPSTAWELIPFSFVVDWFLKVGDFIGALTPRGGVTYLARFQSVRVISTVTRTCTAVRYPLWNHTAIPGSHTRTLETYVREPSVSAPGITFEFGLAEALRGARVYDAFALLIQLFRR